MPFARTLLAALTLMPYLATGQPAGPALGGAFAVGYIETRAAAADAGRAALEAYRDATRQQTGCVAVELFAQTGRPGHFAVLETWRNQAAFDARDASIKAPVDGRAAADPHQRVRRAAVQAADVGGRQGHRRRSYARRVRDLARGCRAEHGSADAAPETRRCEPAGSRQPAIRRDSSTRSARITSRSWSTGRARRRSTRTSRPRTRASTVTRCAADRQPARRARLHADRSAGEVSRAHGAFGVRF